MTDTLLLYDLVYWMVPLEKLFFRYHTSNPLKVLLNLEKSSWIIEKGVWNGLIFNLKNTRIKKFWSLNLYLRGFHITCHMTLHALRHWYQSYLDWYDTFRFYMMMPHNSSVNVAAKLQLEIYSSNNYFKVRKFHR